MFEGEILGLAVRCWTTPPYYQWGRTNRMSNMIALDANEAKAIYEVLFDSSLSIHQQLNRIPCFLDSILNICST